MTALAEAGSRPVERTRQRIVRTGTHMLVATPTRRRLRARCTITGGSDRAARLRRLAGDHDQAQPDPEPVACGARWRVESSHGEVRR